MSYHRGDEGGGVAALWSELSSFWGNIGSLGSNCTRSSHHHCHPVAATPPGVPLSQRATRHPLQSLCVTVAIYSFDPISNSIALSLRAFGTPVLSFLNSPHSPLVLSILFLTAAADDANSNSVGCTALNWDLGSGEEKG